MDDIDDLLDEVESKFCVDAKPKKVHSKPKPRKTSTKSLNEDNLDDIINDIILDDGLDAVLEKNTSKASSSSTKKSNLESSTSKSKLKCNTVYVSGSASVSGSKQRICNQLHCTSCDNKIVIFDQYKWSDADCDYLLFRNNYPDFVRLKSKLLTRKGYRAYCCQCSWLSVKDLVELKSFKPEFKWVCRKH